MVTQPSTGCACEEANATKKLMAKKLMANKQMSHLLHVDVNKVADIKIIRCRLFELVGGRPEGRSAATPEVQKGQALRRQFLEALVSRFIKHHLRQRRPHGQTLTAVDS